MYIFSSAFYPSFPEQVVPSPEINWVIPRLDEACSVCPVRLNRPSDSQQFLLYASSHSALLTPHNCATANHLGPSSLDSWRFAVKSGGGSSLEAELISHTGVPAWQRLACGIPLIDRPRLCRRDCIILFNVSRARSAVTASEDRCGPPLR